MALFGEVRRVAQRLAPLALAVAVYAAGAKAGGFPGPAASLMHELRASAASAADGDDTPGAVYTLMNQVAANGGNAVAIFHRAAGGTLTAAGTGATGGTGTGGRLRPPGGPAFRPRGGRVVAA